jgi:hypothetical protein
MTYIRFPEADKIEFNAVGYNRCVIEAIRLINVTFERYLPRASTEDFNRRADMIRALSAICALLRAVQTFHSSLESLKRRILKLNTELSIIHRRFKLPFTVELSMEESQSVKRSSSASGLT